jgi:hypothetical protein
MELRESIETEYSFNMLASVVGRGSTDKVSLFISHHLQLVFRKRVILRNEKLNIQLSRRKKRRKAII